MVQKPPYDVICDNCGLIMGFIGYSSVFDGNPMFDCPKCCHTIRVKPKMSDYKEVNKFVNVMNSLNHFLTVKNQRYGDSALNPLKIFSKFDEELGGIGQRIDDKLSRINNSDTLRKNDVVDLAGYLILVMLKMGWEDFEDLLD